MGAVAYGRKVDEEADAVRYLFGLEPEVWDGELRIPLEDVDGWSVVGRDDRPSAARYVVGTAYRLRRRTGEWPDRVVFQS